MRYRDAVTWGRGRRGAYASVQVYPEKHASGTSKTREHASLFWLEFDGPDLASSCRGAHHAIRRCEWMFPDLYQSLAPTLYDIRYSGNRSIHLGIDLGIGDTPVEPSTNTTRRYKLAAEQWQEAGDAEFADLGIYSEPRLLSVPGSIRYNTGREIIRLTAREVLRGVRWPQDIIDCATKAPYDRARLSRSLAYQLTSSTPQGLPA